MKQLILLSALLLLSMMVFSQGDTDSTYTTFTTQQIAGYAGNDTCTHAWFISTNEETDTTGSTDTTNLLWARKQSVSFQCTKCGKQTTTLNVWKTYAKDEKDTTGGN